MIKTKLNGKYKIIVPAERAKQYENGWEVARLDSMHKHIGKGDVVYYVGAEMGEMPALCQIWGADVLLFEPNPKAWASIKAIWEANKLDTPICFEGFASNSNSLDRALNFHVKKWPETADKEVIENHGFKELYLEAENYPQVKIDFLVKHTTPPPTAISIDVEGAEYEVLKGAEETLKEYKPKIWLSLHPEFLFHQWGVYANEVRQWLIGLGYEETLIDYPMHECHFLYEAIR